MKTDYDQAALLFAERYGIIEYEVVGNTMIYHEEFPMEKSKYRGEVNLDTMKETRIQVE